MRRSLVTGCLLIGLAGVLAAAVAASTPRAQLRQFTCKRALDPGSRKISVMAVMRPVAGTRRMEMRFVLLRHGGPGPTTIVSGGDLGHWLEPSDPTLGQHPGDVWELKHPVVDLSAPATYRYAVSFRWLGSRQHVIATDVDRSKRCYQPELRPDLMVVSIQVKPNPGQQSSERYVALIRNGGRTAAGPFQVWFSYGDVTDKRSLNRLAANHSVKEAFVGPVCTADTAPTVTVDPTHMVDDYNTSNNSMTANCASAAGTTGS
jgi:CARDB